MRARDCTTEYWSQREAAAEITASSMKNPLAKRAMERLAQIYKGLADRADPAAEAD